MDEGLSAAPQPAALKNSQARRGRAGGRGHSRADGDCDWRRSDPSSGTTEPEAADPQHRWERPSKASGSSAANDGGWQWRSGGWSSAGGSWRDSAWEEAKEDGGGRGHSEGGEGWEPRRAGKGGKRGKSGKGAKGNGRKANHRAQEGESESLDAQEEVASGEGLGELAAAGSGSPDAPATSRRSGGSGRGAKGRGRSGGKGRGGSAGADTDNATAGETDVKEADAPAPPPPKPHNAPRARAKVHSIVDGAAGTVTERLAAQLGRGAYDCMICLIKVARGSPIWSCDKCWAAFHLKCIEQWVKRSSNSNGPEYAWPCPGCRYHRVGRMPEYTCYCGKLLEPQANPHWLAHSCGEVCGRSRGCPHPCTELCHPGPCPRCTAVGSSGMCHCGREVVESMRCGEASRWSCGGACGKQLSCGQHSCVARCHAGPCPPCTVTVKQRCYCRGEEAEQPCGVAGYSCGGPCEKRLECGAHTCQRPCHPGDCDPCPRNPTTCGDRCACGNTRHCSRESAASLLVRWVGKRNKCTDPLPLCGTICGKQREACGHPCRRSCHDGPCGPCNTTISQDCRCGRTHREVVCSEAGQFLCTQVCKVKKTCGNHRCDVVCCQGFSTRGHEAHMCLQVCGKPLACGLHQCEEFCHLGKCAPCRVIQHEPLCCACGASAIEPPVVCGTSPPLCGRQCGVTRSCGHLCLAQCHFGEHPLCYELVDRQCLGGHREMRHQRCHIGAISCGAACGRPLPCGHSCVAQCHAGDCPPCTQPCRARRVHCDHYCEAPCHPGTECEDSRCTRKVRTVCKCGLRVEERLCGGFSGNPRPELPALKCQASCERPQLSVPPGVSLPSAAAGGEPTRYLADLHQLAQQHQRFVQMLEDKFVEVLLAAAIPSAPSYSPPTTYITLPPLDAMRRLLAVEYARLHWRLRTSSKADPAVEGWWTVRIDSVKGARVPAPLLSNLPPGTDRSNLLPPVGRQPCLCFSGSSGPGDQIYELLGSEGLLAVRPGQRSGEVLAFLDRTSLAVAAYRRLTGQAPGPEPAPVRSSGSAWGSGAASGPATSSGGGGLRVLLRQTAAAGAGGGATAKGMLNVSPSPAGHGDGWDVKVEAPRRQKPKQENAAEGVGKDEVLDSWEDALAD